MSEEYISQATQNFINNTRSDRSSTMPDTITVDELKEAIEVWAPKFNLIRELWPGASIEESLSLMSVIEEKAEEIKEDKKSPMGFAAEKEKKTTEKRKK